MLKIIILTVVILIITRLDQTNGQKKKCPPIIENPLCRVPARDQPKTTPIGLIAPKGYYPWYAAIYFTTPNKMVFSCAGSIINENTILTVVQCLYNDRNVIDSKDLLVQVGSNTKYLGGQFFTVHRKTFENSLFAIDHDPALIFLKSSITFTDNIRPICFYQKNPMQMLKSEQWVVGFDKNSRVGSELQHQTLQPSEENQDCNVNHDVYATCDEKTQGVNNCITASGTGLVYQIDGQWSIRGVASTGIFAHKNKNFTVCKDRVWFSDVATNYDWITKTVNSFNGESLCYAPIMDDIHMKGIDVPIGYYPWHVSLYGDGSLGYLCGGSIISKDFILTAAGCFFNGSTEIPASDLYVEHGFGEKVNCFRVASKTYPASKEEAYDKYINNIGILRLRDSITFSESIRPICLTSIPFKHYPETEQWVVGANTDMTNLNHESVKPSGENEDCISQPNYCFTDSDGVETSVAHYGSGLVFKFSKQWFLRGIAVVFSAPEDGCSKTVWIIDVPRHYDWIIDQIKKNV